jgi:hypothetical protein
VITKGSGWEGWRAPRAVVVADETPIWVSIVSTLAAIGAMTVVAFLMWVTISVWRVFR